MLLDSRAVYFLDIPKGNKAMNFNFFSNGSSIFMYAVANGEKGASIVKKFMDNRICLYTLNVNTSFRYFFHESVLFVVPMS